MSTIAESLATLSTRRDSIVSAISDKGGTISSGATLAECATAIANIPSGGGDDVLNSILDRSIVSYTSSGDITLIGTTAFSYCENLTDVFINEGLVRLDTQSFYHCIKLVNISLPSSLKQIGGQAFRNTAIVSIVIPANVTSIGMMAFNSTPLQTLTCKATTPPDLNNVSAFPSSLTNIYVPSESVSAYQSASNWSNFSSIISAIEE